jgi:ribonucrease Y
MDASLIVLIAAAAIIVAVAVGLAVGLVFRRRVGAEKLQAAEEQAQRLLRDAERDAETRRKEVELEIKDRLLRAQADLDREWKDRRQEMQSLERRLAQREESLTQKLDLLDRREKDLATRDRDLQGKERAVAESHAQVQALLDEARRQLERVAGMTGEEAKKHLLSSLENEVRLEAMALAKRIEEEARNEADQKAREILAIAVDKCASDFVAEAVVSVVDLPSDDMKGRIIGREGRNIRAFEKATGIDVIVDDTPEAVILSGFDAVRREIARVSLQRLIADGRIHPARIEEVVEKVKKEVEATIKDAGEQAAFELGITNMHPELLRLVGRLRYRTSYSQNQLQHTKEVARLAGIMAAELGLDPTYAKRSALLHDIGKSADGDHEGTHTQISTELAKKHKEHWKVVNAIAAHHEDEEAQCIEAILLQAADTLSAARPGARRDLVESYVKRLEKLEQIANSFKGVSRAFAIQAGREVRIVVEGDQVSDQASYQMAKDIAKKIEQETEYPGQIKVTVIRETRAVEYAK